MWRASSSARFCSARRALLVVLSTAGLPSLYPYLIFVECSCVQHIQGRSHQLHLDRTLLCAFALSCPHCCLCEHVEVDCNVFSRGKQPSEGTHQQSHLHSSKRACSASTPSYAKHVSSTSARILTGCGVMRLRTFFIIASLTSSVNTSIGLPSFTCRSNPHFHAQLCAQAGIHWKHLQMVMSLSHTHLNKSFENSIWLLHHAFQRIKGMAIQLI